MQRDVLRNRSCEVKEPLGFPRVQLKYCKICVGFRAKGLGFRIVLLGVPCRLVFASIKDVIQE